MDGPHDFLENLGSGVAGAVDAFRLVIAGPHRGHIVGRAAHIPAVLVVGGGAGLARHGHGAQVGLRAGAPGGGVLEHIGHHIGGVGAEGHDGFRLVVNEHAAVGVQNLGVAAGVGEDAVVDKGAVGLGHFPDGNAVGQLPQGHRSVGAVVGHKTGDAQTVLQEVIGGLGPQLVDDLGRHGVQRILQGLQNGQYAEIPAAVVAGIPAGAGQVDIGRVVH